jgi:hypothetical protein
MLPLRHPILALAGGLLLLLSSASSAASIDVLTTPFTGADTRVSIVLTEMGGEIRVDLRVEEGVGDLRGIFFHLADASLLDGLVATGDVVTGFATGDVNDLGLGNNLNGGGGPCPCDFGVALGTPGIGRDDLQVASFVLSHESRSLSLALFSDQWVGVRVTSVGDGSKREASSKLSGRFSPVPEPSTALLLASGLAWVARSRRPRCVAPA